MKHKIDRKQPNSKMCLVCGMKNPFGLKASFFETEAGEVVAVFTPMEEHQSYPGRLHGGIASAILDETIGRAIMIGSEQDFWGVTVEIKTRFRKRIPLGEELRVLGRVTHETKRFFEGTGELILSDGQIAATAEGRYIKLPLKDIADFDLEQNEWRVVQSEDDLREIEI